ncbi:MAG: hypothetical protein HKN93_08455 [Acidimicrobiia bacterium]|nr:hypothetical protein [Acidimicrobiia bacterium]
MSPADVFPISSALKPGPTATGLYNSVSAFEYADRARSHVHPADFYGSWRSPEDNVVTARAFSGNHPSMYNVVTRERSELFLYGGDPPSGSDAQVVKFDVERGEEVWIRSLDVSADAFSWPGLVTAHGNGDLYVVHGVQLARIDAETGTTIDSVELPIPAGVLASDTIFNGFNVTSNGTLVVKSLSRPAGCTVQGLSAVAACLDVGPFPPSLVSTLDPETLEVLGTVEMPEMILTRLAIAEFEGSEFVYMGALDDAIYRIRVGDSGALSLDTWVYEGFSVEGQPGSTEVVVMGDWIVFQTTGGLGTVPMTVHVVSQADPAEFASLDPFDAGPTGISLFPGSLSADPDTSRIYALDAGRGQVGCLQFVEGDEGPELTRLWVVDQTTLNLATLIGPEDARVLVTTDAPGALMALGSGVDEYDEFVVWRSAETGEELTRSDALPAMGIGLSVNPGFSGTILYPAADGTLYELSPRGVDPVCPTG